MACGGQNWHRSSPHAEPQAPQITHMRHAYFMWLHLALDAGVLAMMCRARENLAQERQARVDAEALVADLQEQLTEALRKGESGAAEAAKQKLQELAPEKDAVMVRAWAGPFWDALCVHSSMMCAAAALWCSA